MLGGRAAAFAAADRTRSELDWPFYAGATSEILAGLEARARQRRRRNWRMSSSSAAALLLMAGALWWLGVGEIPDAAPVTPSLIVRKPVHRTLPDGTIVELKEGARIAIAFSPETRRVTLAAGTAHFRVVKETRPFVVDAASVTAQALGTAFSVELERGAVSVLVTEGRVAVNRETGSPASPLPEGAMPPLAVLDAGRAVSVSLASEDVAAAPHLTELAPHDFDDRMAWRIPRLEFNGTPLVEVIARVNEHNPLQFVIADAALERLALSGILRADRVDALVEMLESDFGVKAERRDGIIVLRRPR